MFVSIIITSMILRIDRVSYNVTAFEPCIRMCNLLLDYDILHSNDSEKGP